MKFTDFKTGSYPEKLAPSPKLTNGKQKCGGTDKSLVAGRGQSFSCSANRGYKVIFSYSHHQAPNRKLAHESGPAQPSSVILTCPVPRDTQERSPFSFSLWSCSCPRPWSLQHPATKMARTEPIEGSVEPWTELANNKKKQTQGEVKRVLVYNRVS